MYSIGQVSEMFHLPVSTLRYYDKEGLFPYMERRSGIRRFSERELEALRVIECLKKSGLEIKEIKQFMEENELTEIVANLSKALLTEYDNAIRDGSEDRLNEMLPDHLPPEIQKLYDSAHA